VSKPNTFQAPSPTCPHCGHELDEDEMLYGKPTCDEDLYALAPNEGSTVVQCPRCDLEYAVQGGYKPHYTSAFSLDEL
jgi:transposase-like protein